MILRLIKAEFHPSFVALLFVPLLLLACSTLGAAEAPAAEGVVILEIGGKSEVLRAGKALWDPARTNDVLRSGDRFRTKSNSRATLRLSDRSQIRVGEQSEFQILPATESGALQKLWRGVIYFFHRDKPGQYRFDSPGASAAVRGTEFVMEVDEVGATTVIVLGGEVTLTNSVGGVDLRTGQQGVAKAGLKPTGTAMLPAQLAESVQWVLYYPGVLHLPELKFTDQEVSTLGDSLGAWRNGDVLAALEQYPANRAPQSDAERIYRAGLLLAVGQVQEARSLLAGVGNSEQRDFAEALRRLIAAVLGHEVPAAIVPVSATALLAESYVHQSRSDLAAALASAREAVRRAPDFAFGWARVAELEFSFGRIGRAEEALGRSLALAPRNAQALALQGFLVAARYRTSEAISWFDRAIAVDGAYGNAWLGRGLCQIRQGHVDAGLGDLQTAATLEPQRAVLRSYLGKGYEQAHKSALATNELALAIRMDPKDPTPWLYRALLERGRNRINPAVTDFERSLELNDNRGLYRSRLMLDQDRAVRSSSLAGVYQSAGLVDASVREAARAVSDDYANASAHLFLAESFDALRDPTRFNLRNETVWFNERLLASLLGPAGSVPLSQQLSQQEYSRLFEHDRLGFASATEYRSDGQWREQASQFGTLGKFSYALDLDYQHNNGVRPNNELDRLEWYSTVKFQLTPDDSLLVLAKYQDYHSGDNFQYYDPAQASRYFTYDEKQAPLIVGGWHHQWAPGVHTLLLGGRLENDQSFSDKAAPELILFRDPAGRVFSVGGERFDIEHSSETEIYTAELQQIFQTERHTLILGGRAQSGWFDTRSLVTNPRGNTNAYTVPAASTRAQDDFIRGSAYGYYTVELPTRLRLTGGLAYDAMRLPSNFRSPPVSDGEESRHQLSPKAALVWNPVAPITLRGIYAKSLGGVSLDESFRLEPTQLAGFPQSFRNIISESLVGSVAGPEYETAGVGLDFKLPARIYAGVQVERLTSRVEQDIGEFDFIDFTPPLVPGSTRQHLDYVERGFSAYVAKLFGNEWSAVAKYRYTWSELEQSLPEIPNGLPGSSQVDRAELHNVNLFLHYNHASGFFARAETQIFWQHNAAASASLEDDSFYQVNLWAGFRFPRQRGEISIGVLNLNAADYRLNPLTPYSELPRERVFAARLLFNF